ncbi:MAG: hypothetical protein IKL87_06140 [Oscillospiraceae bacterium]|nr:hypothetical protein [Oscillospiraceae bacterium]
MSKLAFLTGKQMVKKIRNANLASAFGGVLLWVLGVVVILAAVANVRNNHDYASAILMMLVGAALLIGGGALFIAKLVILKDVANCKVFRKYGSPDELAAEISEAAFNNLIDSKQVLVSDRFLLAVNNFESFMPYESVRLLYKKEHRTNGILDGIFLVAWDEYGDSFDYPFKVGKRNAAVFENACNEIANRCTNARFGYNAENLKYAKSLRKEI